MAGFKLHLTDGRERVIEDTDSLGRWELLETFEPSDVSAVYRRGPAESNVHTWIARPATGRWWSY